MRVREFNWNYFTPAACMAIAFCRYDGREANSKLVESLVREELKKIPEVSISDEEE